jgi:hypothetical protein
MFAQVSAELARLARLLRGGMVLAALFVEDTLLALTPLTVPRTAVRLVSRVLSLALGALLVWQFLNVRCALPTCSSPAQPSLLSKDTNMHALGTTHTRSIYTRTARVETERPQKLLPKTERPPRARMCVQVLVLVAACALGVFFATRSLLDGRDASTATAATAAHHNDAYDDVIDHRSRAATFADDWWAGVHDPRRFGYGWWRTLRDAVEDAAVFDNTKTLWSWVDDSADWSEGATGRGNEGDGDSRRRRPEKDAARRDDFATATTRSNTWRDDEDGRAPATGTPGASGSYTYRGGGGGGGTSERWREEPDGPEPSQRARQPDPRRWEGRPRQRDRERPPYAGQRPRRRNADLLDVWWDNDGDAASPR